MKLVGRLRCIMCAEGIYILMAHVLCSAVEKDGFIILLGIAAQAAILVVMLVWIVHPLKTFEDTLEYFAGEEQTEAELENIRDTIPYIREMKILVDKYSSRKIRRNSAEIFDKQTELTALQSQINPHFLYNTLDTIIWLAEAGKQKEVVDMVGSLSEFFRTSLNQGKDIIPIREELQHVKSYLEIQQVRYQDILEYEIHMPEELEKYLIPKITIQPIVENALYHGIKNKRGLGHILINGRREKNHFVIQIEDNGIGISEERLAQVRDKIQYRSPAGNDIYGLYNVNERIHLNFGEKFGISIESDYGDGTVVSILLPYMEEGV